MNGTPFETARNASGLSTWHHMIFAGHAPSYATRTGAIQFLLGHASVLTTERYLGCKQNLEQPVNDRFGSLIPIDAQSE